MVSLSRRESVRWPGSESPFCALTVAVDLDDAAVDHGVFEVGVLSQGSDDTIECIGLHPPAEALEDRVPFPELPRKVTSRAPGSSDPEHRLDKKPGIRPRAPKVTLPTKAVRGDDHPLKVGQSHPGQG